MIYKIVPTHACSILALPGTKLIQENSLLHYNTRYTKFNCYTVNCYTGMCIVLSVTLYLISGIKSA